jgi:hypothetical protein
MKSIVTAKVGSWAFWKASIICAMLGAALGAFLALLGL